MPHNFFVEERRKTKQQLIEFVVGKELNIKDAAEIIEAPEKEEEKIIKEVVEERKLREKDFISLYKKFKELKKDSALLKQQNKKLKDQLASLKKDYSLMFKQISKTNIDQIPFPQGRRPH